MAKDKYIGARRSVSGYSFANLGMFTGFADGIYNAVYALVILEIFKNSAIVGIYVAIYSIFCMIAALFAMCRMGISKPLSFKRSVIFKNSENCFSV